MAKAKPTLLEKWMSILQNRRWSAVIVGAWLILIAISKFWEAASQLPFGRRSPSLRISLENRLADGTSILQFKILYAPPSFEIDRVILQLSNISVRPATGSPSDQIKKVFYSVKVPWDISNSKDPSLNITDIRLFHDPKEPFAQLELILWYEAKNDQITFDAKPTLYSADGRILRLAMQPPSVSITLRNYSTVEATMAK